MRPTNPPAGAKASLPHLIKNTRCDKNVSISTQFVRLFLFSCFRTPRASFSSPFALGAVAACAGNGPAAVLSAARVYASRCVTPSTFRAKYFVRNSRRINAVTPYLFTHRSPHSLPLGWSQSVHARRDKGRPQGIGGGPGFDLMVVASATRNLCGITIGARQKLLANVQPALRL